MCPRTCLVACLSVQASDCVLILFGHLALHVYASAATHACHMGEVNTKTAEIMKEHCISLYTKAQLDVLFPPLEQKSQFIEMWCPPRMAPALKDLSLNTLPSIDVLNGWNLLDDAHFEHAMSMLSMSKCDITFLCPPCTTHSKLWHSSKNKMDPEVRATQKAEGLKLLERALQVARFQLESGRKFVFEHPEGASSFQHPLMKEVQKDSDVCTIKFDQCRFGLKSKVVGMPHRKPTVFVTNVAGICAEFANMRCQCSEPHVQVQGREGGQTRASWASRYPDPMVRAIVRGVARASGA